MRITWGLLAALLVMLVVCFVAQVVSEQPRAPDAGEGFCMREMEDSTSTGIPTDGEPATPWPTTYAIVYTTSGGAAALAEQNIICEPYDKIPHPNEAWCQEVAFTRKTCTDLVRQKQRATTMDALNTTANYASGRKSRRITY